MKNYLIRNNTKELSINKTQRIIVALWSIFSGPLLVISHIQELISLKFRDTFLFCINTINTSNTEIITSLNFKISNIGLFFRK